MHVLPSQQGSLFCKTPNRGTGQASVTFKAQTMGTPVQTTEDGDSISEPDTYCTRRLLPDPSSFEPEPASLRASLEDKHPERPRKQRRLQEDESLGWMPLPSSDEVDSGLFPLLHPQVLRRENRTRALAVTVDSGVRWDRGRERNHETESFNRSPGTGCWRNHTPVLPPCQPGRRPDSAGVPRLCCVRTGGQSQHE